MFAQCRYRKMFEILVRTQVEEMRDVRILSEDVEVENLHILVGDALVSSEHV